MKGMQCITCKVSMDIIRTKYKQIFACPICHKEIVLYNKRRPKMKKDECEEKCKGCKDCPCQEREEENEDEEPAMSGV